MGLLISTGSPALALDARRLITQYLQRRWSLETAYPDTVMYRALQTRDGFLWLATTNGLLRFDGIRFERFSFQAAGAKNDRAYVLAQTADESLWAGTLGAGLVRFRDGRFTVFTVKDGLGSDIVDSLYSGADGALWIASRGGLNRYKDGRLELFKNPDGKLADDIATVGAEGGGGLWVGTRAGAYRFRDGRFTKAAWANAKNVPTAVTLDGAGNLWVRTLEAVGRLEDGKVIEIPGSAGVSCIFTDHAGNTWLAGSTESGLGRVRGNRIEWLPRDSARESPNVWDIFEDREGSLWLVKNEVLVQLRMGRFVRRTSVEGYPGKQVQAMLQDRQGRVLLATARGGIFAVANTGPGEDEDISSISNQDVAAVAQDDSGDLWVATASGDIYRVNAGVWKKIFLPPGKLREVQALLPDRDGSLWICTYNGLYLFIGGDLRRYGRAEGLPSDKITTIQRDSQGQIWVGTDAGLSRRQGGGFQTFTVKDGLAGPYIHRIAGAKAGGVWVATLDGLSRVSGSTITTYTTANGLLRNRIYEAVEDQSGDLWLGTDAGVDRIAAQETSLEKGFPLHPRHFGKADGLPDLILTAPILRDREERLWFATSNGLATIEPGEVLSNPVPPPVRISAASADREPLAFQGSHLKVGPSTHRLEFSYAALTFVTPELASFSYLLEGYDQHWFSASGAQRELAYTALRPGSYRLQIRAANADGVWNPQAAFLDVELEPYFYQTRWFAALATFVAAALLWAAYQFRVRQIKRRFSIVLSERLAERGRIARELHDTLLQGFSGLVMHLEAVSSRIESAPGESRRKLSEILTMMEQYLREARLSIDELRAESPAGGGLKERLAAMLAHQTACSEIAGQFTTNGPARRLQKDTEDQLYRIAQEAVINAVRHAGAKTIQLLLQYSQQGAVTLQVTDDGCGFDGRAERPRAGHFGLVGMRERAKAIGALLEIRSAAECGTTVEVKTK